MQYKKDYFRDKLKLFLVIIACLLYFPAYAADSSSDDNTNIAKSSYYYDAMKLIKSKAFEAAIKNLNKNNVCMIKASKSLPPSNSPLLCNLSYKKLNIYVVGTP